VHHMGILLMTPTHVTVPFDLLADLWKYGMLAPVEGVLYGKSHRDRLAEADRLIGEAYDSDAQRLSERSGDKASDVSEPVNPNPEEP
jgi:hypothetical protein